MTPAPPADPAVPRLEARLAPFMFGLGFVFLLVVAGLIHRAHEPQVTRFELQLMAAFLAVLWPLFAAEAVVGYVRRAAWVSKSRAAVRALLVTAFPPMRMAWVHPATDRIWLPRLGWQPRGKVLLKRLDKAFGGPMLAIAFLILPVLALEYFRADAVRDVPWFAFALDASIGLIWVAFAVEFVLKFSAAPSRLAYARERWLDVAIVALPTLEVVLTHWVDAAPLARLLRLGRVLAPDQLGQIGRAYRLRGLLMKGWHAVLLFEVVARVTGNSPEKRLRKVEEQIADLEEQVAELRAHAVELRKQVPVSREAGPGATAPIGPPLSPR